MFKLGLFADKKLYLMQDDKGATVIKSRGVGRAIESGRDILNKDDFIKLFKGEALKIFKTKFLIQSDGIYIKPQTITVRIALGRLLKIQEELKVIFANIKHSLYTLALKIGRIDITALHILSPLAIIPYDYDQGIHSLVLFKGWKNRIIESILYVFWKGLVLTSPQFSSKFYTGVDQVVLYRTKNGVTLDYQQFCSKINCGIVLYIYYGTLLGICVTSQQFNSRVYAGLTAGIIYIAPNAKAVALDYRQFHSNINCGLIVYNSTRNTSLIYFETLISPIILVTPSAICLFSNDPRTNFIFRNYTIKANSKRVIFKTSINLYNCKKPPITDS